MENNILLGNSNIPNIDLIKKETKYKLIITEELENKIRFLCNKLPDNEYSGTLFYTTEGNFKDNNLIITAVDFYLQDIGSATGTSFSSDATLAGYIVEHGLFTCYQGLMH